MCVTQAVARLGVVEKTIYEWIRLGRLPAVRENHGHRSLCPIRAAVEALRVERRSVEGVRVAS